MTRWGVFADSLTLELCILSDEEWEPEKYLPMSPDWRDSYEEAEKDLAEIERNKKK